MKKIAIVDDDNDARENLAILVEDAGYEPELIVGTFGNEKEQLINEIKLHNVFGVISDHRLSHGNLASFYGSELLASMYDLKIPSILITQFLDVDADTSIRKYRDKLPAVIGRGTQSPELITRLLDFSKREIVNGRTVSRKPHRALIRIDDYCAGLQDGVIEGVVTNWSSESTVKFPIELIPENVRLQMSCSDINRLIAFVNTGASSHSELFITDIHLAPVLEGINELS